MSSNGSSTNLATIVATPSDNAEWEYIPLTTEQSATLWNDVALWVRLVASNRYMQSVYQQCSGSRADYLNTYYLRVKKETTNVD